MYDSDVQAFRRVLDVERVYHDSELTVASLAARVAIPEYRLRRLIHERLRYRNFNALLHRYRIEEACALLADPQRRPPILTIALTVGYNSINPFNRAFRELKGMTPSEFPRPRARRFLETRTDSCNRAPLAAIDMLRRARVPSLRR